MQIFDTSATFTRPADTTAYTSGDLVANSVTNTSVVPMTFRCGGRNLKIYRAGVLFNSSTNTNGKFKLHLYTSKPTVTNGDNGAWLSIQSGYQDNIAIDCTGNAFSDNSYGTGIYVSSSLNIPLLIASTNEQIYGLLMATAAYTPTSGEIFTVNLVGESYN